MKMYHIICRGTVGFGYSLSNIPHFRGNILGVSLELTKDDQEHDTINIHIFTNNPQIFMSLTKAELDKMDNGNFRLVCAEKIDENMEDHCENMGLLVHLCIHEK
eukprot:scpid59365/ scgid17660/ 